MLLVDEGGLWSFELYGPLDADVALILLPAMGVPARYYDPFAEQLLERGVALIRANFLANQVARDPLRPIDGFAALIEECMPTIFQALHSYQPEAKPVIVGHSLGGQLGLVAAARFAPETPVVLIASGSAWYLTFDGARRWLYRIGSQAIHGIARMIGHWPGDVLRFGGRQPLALIRDWSRVVQTGRYHAATGTFDYEAELFRFRGDVLTIDVTGDVLATPASTRALLAKSPAARVEQRSYAPLRGAAKPGAHFTWVRDHSELASLIVAWARAR